VEKSEKTKTVPVAPRPGPARAADALKRLSLLNGTKTKKSKKPLKASLELKSPPVDAEAAAAVFGGGGVKSPAAANGAGVLSVSPARAGKAQEKKKEKKKSMSVANVVPAPTGSGAHKHQWDSFVDWKMMEHQDYETIPDAEFEKLSEKLHIKEKWRPMVSYLVSLGLTTKELEKCLVNCEEIFKRPVAKVMTRVEYLQNELGFEGAELKKLIHKEPAILLQRNRHTVPRCRYLTELGVPAERLPTMLRKQPQILHLSVEKGLKPRVAYFKNELLIPEADIPKMLERNPAVLTFSIENQVQPRVDFLRDLGISRDGVMKMIVRHPHVLQYSFEGLEEHINFLSSIGMNEEDVVHTVTRLSQLFSLSVKDSLRPKFKYMTDELGGDHKTCVKFPAYFSLSLDQRIKPRHTYLKQYDCAPDPFPMKYLSENDAAFAARSAPSGGSLADFEEYREVAAARFKAETLQAKERAMESLHAEQRRAQMREARIAQQRRLQVQNQGYSQRIVDARNSMNRVRIIGAARKSR
jgi:mTERF domain-containing protein